MLSLVHPPPILPLLSAISLSKAYGKQQVLSDLSFVISEGAHIGLIGRNGAGKTTLLRILGNTEEADHGEVQLMPACRLGILNQHNDVETQHPASLRRAATVLAYLEETSERPSWECQKLSSRFGLTPTDLAKTPSSLSGGYQMRVKIVRMLLGNPNLLLLDEPVNFLDLPTLLLLEQFLRDYPGAFVMTSHDRELMQNTCTSTWEIERAKLTIFPEPVEQYLDWKEEQAEYARRTNKRLKKEIAHAQAFADRFRAKASLASSAQSKLKHITKLRTQLQEISDKMKTAAFRINCPLVTKGSAVRFEHLTIGYEDRPIVTNLSMDVPRGSKVAIVGENGQGKSTLLKTLAGIIPPVDGVIRWYKRADLGFFSQHNETTLHPNMTVLQTLTAASPPYTPAERLLATAGAFLFKDDDLEKPCRVLSGGEQARLRLASLVLHEYNVLLLDEPTNHLDAETVEVLARALKEYPGTLFVVSHARTFMNAIVDRVYEIDHGGMRLYPGSYEEYVSDLMDRASVATILQEETPKLGVSTGQTLATLPLLREQQKRLKKIENELAVFEKEKGDILAFFFENPTDYAPAKFSRLKELDEEIERLEKRWMMETETNR
ncbi:ABC-F family ATP-binding cassette domain-containing protein [Candidatus Uhrbacteria bacterium]|nr:ABC-F family ATP-binding cassette domain-containing protein [Candidatus Uhrbacteria bacterium]